MKKLLLFFLITFIIPIIIINLFFNIKESDISGFNHNTVDKVEKKVNVRILKKDNTVENIDLENYLIGVVSSEVPISFEDEAIKAQAVASRTYALKQIENNKSNSYDVTDNTLSQVYSTDEELKEKWGNNYENNYKKIKDLIDKTKGEYVSYNDDFIYAFFFSTSNGYTEDNKNVFGQDLPYLKTVDSSFDKEETSAFKTEIQIEKKDFFNKLGIDNSNTININNVSKSESNRILYLEINGIGFKGREFQKLLGLRSNDFFIEDLGDKVKITTTGYGHGVGLSQYGANALAKRKKNYKEILEYYYKGTEIKKL